MRIISIIIALFCINYVSGQIYTADSLGKSYYSADFLPQCKYCIEQANGLIQYPKAAKENKITGLVVLKVTIDTNGNIQRVTSLSNIGYGLEEEAIRVTKLLKGYSCGFKYGYPQIMDTFISFDFKNENDVFKVVIKAADFLDEKRKEEILIRTCNRYFSEGIAQNSDRYIQYASPPTIMSYILDSLRFKHTSLNRFKNYETIKLKIPNYNSDNTALVILLHEYKCYADNVYRKKGTLKISYIPVDTKITVIAIQNINNHPYFCFSSFDTKKGITLDLDYKRMSYHDLKEVIDKLDKE